MYSLLEKSIHNSSISNGVMGQLGFKFRVCAEACILALIRLSLRDGSNEGPQRMFLSQNMTCSGIVLKTQSYLELGLCRIHIVYE